MVAAVAASGQKYPPGHLPAHVELVWPSALDEPRMPAAHGYGKVTSIAPAGTANTFLPRRQSAV